MDASRSEAEQGESCHSLCKSKAQSKGVLYPWVPKNVSRCISSVCTSDFFHFEVRLLSVVTLPAAVACGLLNPCFLLVPCLFFGTLLQHADKWNSVKPLAAKSIVWPVSWKKKKKKMGPCSDITPFQSELHYMVTFFCSLKLHELVYEFRQHNTDCDMSLGLINVDNNTIFRKLCNFKLGEFDSECFFNYFPPFFCVAAKKRGNVNQKVLKSSCSEGK